MTYQSPTGGQGPATIYTNVDADGLGTGGFGARVNVTDETELTGALREQKAELHRKLNTASELCENLTDQANEPRYPNFKGILAARKTPVEVLSLADLGVDPGSVGAAGARTEVVVAAARPAREHRVLVTDDGTAGTALAAYLVENKLV